MIDYSEQSLINIAESILKERKQPMELYELFDLVLQKRGVDEEVVPEVLNAFYADLTSSARFVYTGQNTWDLKKYQKIELWEKDGSFFNEYAEVEDEELDAIIAQKAELEKEHQEKLVRRREAEEADRLAALEETELITDPQDEAPIVVDEEEVVIEEVLEEETPVVEVAKGEDDDVIVETETEETEEEYDDFDEDEYNEYMDTYEDEYDK